MSSIISVSVRDAKSFSKRKKTNNDETPAGFEPEPFLNRRADRAVSGKEKTGVAAPSLVSPTRLRPPLATPPDPRDRDRDRDKKKEMRPRPRPGQEKKKTSLTLPVGNQSANTIFKKIRLKKRLTPAGFEPALLRIAALTQRLRPLGHGVYSLYFLQPDHGPYGPNFVNANSSLVTVTVDDRRQVNF